jgi:hypothetical protein
MAITELIRTVPLIPEAYMTWTAPKKTCPDHPVNPVEAKMRDTGKVLHELFK